MKKKSKKSGWYKKLPVLVMSDWAILDPPALYLTVLFKLWPKNMQRWQFVPNDSAPHSDGRIVKKQETRNLCLNRKRESINDVNLVSGTGKSLSEALIFALTNPQYDERLFIELQVQYMKIPSSNLGRTCCVQKLFQNNFCTQHVLPMFCKKKSFWQRFTCNKV
jgi:hypothetical protein